MKKDVRFYNVLFPLWILLLFPAAWWIVLPGNFIIDSVLLLVALHVMKIAKKWRFYVRYILPIYLLGLVADGIGSLFALAMCLYFNWGGPMADDLTLTIPALLLSAGMIFVFHYFVIFRKQPKPLRLRMALTFAIATAPYTFLIPSAWIY